MKNWRGRECGLVGISYCAGGNNYVAGPGSEYYAYCAKKQGMEIILRFILRSSNKQIVVVLAAITSWCQTVQTPNLQSISQLV